MRVWIACFVVLFAVAQLFDWVQQFYLPLPICILGGAFLAVASNYDKLFGSYLRDTLGAVVEASNEPLQLDASASEPVSVPLITSSSEKTSLEAEAQE